MGLSKVNRSTLEVLANAAMKRTAKSRPEKCSISPSVTSPKDPFPISIKIYLGEQWDDSECYPTVQGMLESLDG
jgi:hypothetical protein